MPNTLESSYDDLLQIIPSSPLCDDLLIFYLIQIYQNSINRYHFLKSPLTSRGPQIDLISKDSHHKLFSDVHQVNLGSVQLFDITFNHT